jgi:hypothetical protein
MPEITDANLFKLFVGKQSIDTALWDGDSVNYRVRRLDLDTEEMKDYYCSIKQNDLEDIKDIFLTGSLQSLHRTEHLLLIFWFREVKFMMGSLLGSDMLDFAQSVFTLNSVDIDEETVRWELRVLLHKEYISKGITGDAENADYFLRPAGIRVAEELFDRMKTLASANAESTSKDANRKRTSKATAEASQKSIERADVNINNPNDVCAPVVKAINQLPAKMSRVLTRFHTPLDNDDVQEDEMEMIDFNYQNGMKWKDNVMAVFPNTPKDELDTKVDSIRKQHRKEFPYSYES